MINQVIGIYATSGAFVFGTYSFAEKIINGILIMAISSELDNGSGDFINQANFIIPVISLLIGVFLVFIDLEIPKFGDSDFNEEVKDEKINDYQAKMEIDIDIDGDDLDENKDQK